MERLDNSLEFFLDEGYMGFGLSEGLTRGVQTAYAGQTLTQEGMGIGSIALKRGGLTYFSRKSDREAGGISYTCYLDTVLISSIMNIPCGWLSHIWHFGTAIYRKLPDVQPWLLSCASVIRRLFRVDNCFRETDMKGTARFQTAVRDSGLDVRCEINVPGNTGKVCIMNEMGADWFGSSWLNGQAMGPPPPWEQIGERVPYPSLYSEQLQLLFSLHGIELTDDIPFQVFWGREQNENLCWAGYTIEVDLRHSSVPVLVCSYKIDLKRLEREVSEGWRSM